MYVEKYIYIRRDFSMADIPWLAHRAGKKPSVELMKSESMFFFYTKGFVLSAAGTEGEDELLIGS